MSTICHLHLHSDRSLLDGLPSPAEIVNKAIALGSPAVAITDHGNLFAVPQFYEHAINNNIKPIIGCEFYFVNSNSFEKKREDYHLLILAKNDEGVKNIFKLSTLSYTEGFYYRPRINKEMLIKYKEGLIVTTGCIASVINQKIIKGDLKGAYLDFLWFHAVFGEDFYVEIQDHGLKEQSIINKVLLEWARNLNIKIIATNDAHYINREDSYTHDILLAVQTGTRLDDKNRLRFVDDRGELCSEFYMKSYDEFMNIPVFRENPEAIMNTFEVAEKCNTKINFSSKLLLPHFDTGELSQDDYLKKLVYEGIKKRYGGEPPDYVYERIEKELDIIKKLGFSGYFLIVQDIVNYAHSNGILVGPGRGSAVGSLVAYALGITQINPLNYDLIFERFLNPARINPPDIDIDFQHDRREDIISYIKNKYGENRVAHIATFSFMGVKAALRDAMRALGIEPQDANRFASLIPDKVDENTFAKITDPSFNPDYQEIINMIEKDKRYKQAIEITTKIIGKPRQSSIHASGIIISPENLTDIMPLMVVSSDVKKTKTLATQFDMYDLEKFGLLKVDILGLNTLNIIKEIIEDIKNFYDIDIDIYNLPLDDEKTYNLFQKAQTIGIFQFESDGIRQVLIDMKPDCFDDLVAINALYRPGPIEQIPVYIRRKRGEEKPVFFDPRVEPILRSTYGIMIYQEQVMQVAQVLAGFTLSEADEFRRGIGKMEIEKITKNKNKFIQGCVKNGLSEEKASEIFDLILKFAGYGFNKSHAVAYSYIAYATAYLKANYPLIFYKALFNGNITDYDEIEKIFEEARKEGISVATPNINVSEYLFAVKDGVLYHGLAGIRNVKSDVIKNIIHERNKKGQFRSLTDFLVRMSKYDLDKRTLESLIYAGALNEIASKENISSNVLMHEKNIESIVDYYKKISKKKDSRIEGIMLFEDFSVPRESISVNKSLFVSEEYIMQKSKEYLGYYIFDVIISKYTELIKSAGLSTNCTWEATVRKSEKIIGCFIITSKEKKISRNKREYWIINLKDEAGTLKTIMYPDNRHKFDDLICGYPFAVSLARQNDLYIINDIIKISKEAHDQITTMINKNKQNINNKKENKYETQKSDEKHQINIEVVENKVEKTEYVSNEKTEEYDKEVIQSAHHLENQLSSFITAPYYEDIERIIMQKMNGRYNFEVLNITKEIIIHLSPIIENDTLYNKIKDNKNEIIDVLTLISSIYTERGYYWISRFIFYRIFEIISLTGLNGKMEENIIEKVHSFYKKYNETIKKNFF